MKPFRRPLLLTAAVFGLTALSLSAQETVKTTSGLQGQLFEKWKSSGDARVQNATSAFSPVSVKSATGGMKITAEYVAPTVKNSLILRGNGSGSITPAKNQQMIFDSEKTLELKAVPDADSAFEKWTGQGAVEIADPASPSTKITVKGANTTVTAVFRALKGILSINADGHGTVAPKLEKQKMDTGRTVTVKAQPSDGFHFNRWDIYGDAVVSDKAAPETQITLTGYQAIAVARFTGSLSEHGTPIKPPAETTMPQAAAMTGISESGSDPIFNLQIQSTGKGRTSPISGTYTGSRTKITVKAIPDAGAKFDRWRTAGDVRMAQVEKPEGEVFVLGSGTLTAEFMPEIAILQLKTTPEGTVTPAPDTLMKVKTLEPVKIQAKANPSFRFVTWQIRSGNAQIADPRNPETEVRVKQDTVIQPVFALEKAKATLPPPVVAAPQKQPKKPEIPVEIGTLVTISDDSTIEAFPPVGYFFSSWKVTGKAKVADPLAIKTKVFFDPGATVQNSSVSAVFIPELVQLQIEVLGNGSVLPAIPPNGKSLQVNAETRIQAVPGKTSRFIEWKAIGGAEIADPKAAATTVKLESNAILTAVFENKPVTVTVRTDTPQGGTIPKSRTLNAGTECRLKAVPAEGYRFDGWLIEFAGKRRGFRTPEAVFKPTADTLATAFFTAEKAELTLSVSGDGRTAPESCRPISVSTADYVTISVAAGPEWAFSNWDTQGDVQIENPSKPETRVKIRSGSALVIANLYRLNDRYSKKRAALTENPESLADSMKKAIAKNPRIQERLKDTSTLQQDAAAGKEPSWCIATDGLYPDQVKLFWQYSGAEYFEIQRMKVAPDPNRDRTGYETLADRWSGKSYTDMTAEPYVIYRYKVLAKNRRDKVLSEAEDSGFRK